MDRWTFARKKLAHIEIYISCGLYNSKLDYEVKKDRVIDKRRDFSRKLTLQINYNRIDREIKLSDVVRR